MYKVFLVDDEIVVREGIRNSIQWEQTPYLLAGEAADGEMALSMMKDIKPDILVTDIKMAFLDGLKLSRIIKKTLPWIKIIIISGHDEFQYAKAAISIGVEEYLLKPVSASDMLASLDKVAGMIEQEKKYRTSIEALTKQVQSTSDLLRERWLGDLVSGAHKPEEVMEKAGEMGIELIAHGYLVAVIDLHFPEGNASDAAAVKRTIASLLENRPEAICFSRSNDSLVLLLKNSGQESLEENAYTLGQVVKYEVERNFSCRVAFGIGTAVERIGEISRSYYDAQKASKYLERAGQSLILGFNDMESLADIDFLKLDGDPIAQRLKYAGKGDIDGIIKQYLELIGENNVKSAMAGYYMIGDIMMAASKIVEELGATLHDVIPSLKEKKVMEIISSRKAFDAEVRAILEAVIAFRDSRNTGKYHNVIQKAKNYIDGHFADPDISLHSVAAEVALSPNHFSTIFSQGKGETFIEYLTHVRISKSKQLLANTNMKSADIAYDVGFSDPHYFSFIFKKITGISPREFRSANKK